MIHPLVFLVFACFHIDIFASFVELFLACVFVFIALCAACLVVSARSFYSFATSHCSVEAFEHAVQSVLPLSLLPY